MDVLRRGLHLGNDRMRRGHCANPEKLYGPEMPLFAPTGNVVDHAPHEIDVRLMPGYARPGSPYIDAATSLIASTTSKAPGDNSRSVGVMMPKSSIWQRISSGRISTMPYDA